MTSSAFLERLDTLAGSCFQDSQRWFPELHRRPRSQIAGHYALGLIGEVGEVEEVLYITRDASALAPELADCLVYSLDLAALFGWHTAGLLEADDRLPSLVLVELGRLANTAKKINRGDPLGPELLTDFHRAVGFILRRTLMIARQNGIDLEHAYHDKHAELVKRWGPPWTPPNRPELEELEEECPDVEMTILATGTVEELPAPGIEDIAWFESTVDLFPGQRVALIAIPDSIDVVR